MSAPATWGAFAQCNLVSSKTDSSSAITKKDWLIPQVDGAQLALTIINNSLCSADWTADIREKTVLFFFFNIKDYFWRKTNLEIKHLLLLWFSTLSSVHRLRLVMLAQDWKKRQEFIFLINSKCFNMSFLLQAARPSTRVLLVFSAPPLSSRLGQ